MQKGTKQEKKTVLQIGMLNHSIAEQNLVRNVLGVRGSITEANALFPIALYWGQLYSKIKGVKGTSEGKICTCTERGRKDNLGIAAAALHSCSSFFFVRSK